MPPVPTFSIVDACQRGATGGSPTAVLDDGPFSDAERRAVPLRAGTSHAAFVSPDGTVRFFTSAGELPACGHGTVAVLAFLAHRTGRPDHLLRTAAQTIRGHAARRSDGRFTATFDPGPITTRPPTETEIFEISGALCFSVSGRADKDTLRSPGGARGTGRGTSGGAAGSAGGASRSGWGTDGDASEIGGGAGGSGGGGGCVATLGRARILVPVDGLRGISPEFGRLGVVTRLLGCFVYTRPGVDGRCAARLFAPGIGVPEDVANANSVACLAFHLGRDLTVDMGDSLGLPATIFATAGSVGGVASVRS